MKKDQEIFDLIQQEHQRQKNGIELIASENFVSEQVMMAMGSCLTNKYAEGYPRKRYYGGCEVVDKVEQLAIDRAKELFGVEYVNVQPHSGSQANAAVMLACLNPGDKILGFNLSHGGHLTHGSPVNFSGKLYSTSFYSVEEESGKVDYEKLEQVALEEKPKLIICGASAYSQDWNYKRFREIADKVDALLMADIAHPAGLIAAKLLNNAAPHCHILTTTTHKTLRGPRGGMIMMGKDRKNPFGVVAPKSGRVKNMSELIDSMVMPGIQGGPLMHIIAAKAVAFGEALQPSFKDYTSQIVQNAKTLAEAFLNKDYHLVSGGTDTHVILIDLTNKKITGKVAEKALEKAGITVNKNMVPFDERSPFITSGIRIGTPAITTRGMKEDQMLIICDLIDQVISDPENDDVISNVISIVKELCDSFPLYDDLLN